MSDANMSGADRMYDRPYEPDLKARIEEMKEVHQEWHLKASPGLLRSKCYLCKTLQALLAVLEIQPEDARMAKFKAQDFQDGYNQALADVIQRIFTELEGKLR